MIKARNPRNTNKSPTVPILGLDREWLHQWLHQNLKGHTMPQPKKSHRLHYGEGSFYWDNTRKIWRGVIEAGLTPEGKRRRYTVSSRNEDEAWRKLTTKIKEVNAGKATLTASDATTLNDWTAQWLDDHKASVRPKTYATDAGQIRKWIIPTLGRTQLRDLDASATRKLAKTMRDAGRSTTTINYTQALLQRICTAAKAEGYMVPDTLLLAKRARKAASTRDAIPIPDALRLIEAALATPNGSRWVAALLQGMRQGECLGLTWDRVNIERGLIDISWQLQALPYNKTRDRASGFRVPDGYEARHLEGRWHLVRPKTAKGQRVIPLVPWMAQAFTEWRATAPESPHGLVWPLPDGGIRDDVTDRGEWYALQDAAKVCKPDGSHYVLHEARHTTATLLLEVGVDPEIIKAILGHSSIVTSRGYQHVNHEMTRRALEKIAGVLQLEG